MGSFSWMYANTNNTQPLNSDNVAFLYCPDGTIIKEPAYGGYGKFGSLHDVYELVADWNREFLSEHPEFLIYQSGREEDKNGNEVLRPPKRVDSFPWYGAYSDLSLTREDILERWKKETGGSVEYRWIGIDIACYNAQNAWLPFPIKIATHPNASYYELPASMADPNQGFGRYYSVKKIRDSFTPSRVGKRFYVCPNCGGKHFVVTVRLEQKWLVDEYGIFQKPHEDEYKLPSEPADNQIWRCSDCGYEDEGGNLLAGGVPQNEKRYTFLIYDRNLNCLNYYVPGIPGLPCYDNKVELAFTSDDLSEVIRKAGTYMGYFNNFNIVALRDNLTKVAITAPHSGEKTQTEHLIAFLTEATDEKRGKYILLALQDAAKKKRLGDEMVSVDIDTVW